MTKKNKLNNLRFSTLTELLRKGTREMSKAQLKILLDWLEELQNNSNYAFDFLMAYIEQMKNADKT